ncbi:hypothetical protein [Fulvimarina sp. MAC3]|uniref:hypothetical protein n=1 Tax=Fulvimarina sp. MAC3 TaxID=3148887 RepID=UPI0031FD215E
MSIVHRRTVLLGLLALPIAGEQARANAEQPFDDPSAPIIDIVELDGSRETFSRDDLAGFELTGFTTALPWNGETAHVEGPSIADLVRSVDPKGEAKRIEIEALDGFVVAADIEQLVADGAILALRQDGELLPVSRKGPAFLMFPFDDRPDVKDQFRFGQCIWQITRIELS